MFGRGRTRLQPVHVEDVAAAIARILGGAPGAARPCYEFGGPRIYAFADLLRTVADAAGVRARLLPVPFALWEALALAAEFLPGAAPADAHPGRPRAPRRPRLGRCDRTAEPPLGKTAIEDILPALAERERAGQ